MVLSIVDRIADLNNHLTDLRKCREPKGLVKELAVDLSMEAADDLVREPADLVREAVNLVKEYQLVHSGLLESSLTF